MPDASIKTLDSIIGKSLIGVEAILQEFRSRIVKELGEHWNLFASPAKMAEIARTIVTELEPMLVDHLTDADLTAWIAGMDALSNKFPPWLVKEFQTGIRSYGSPPEDPPPVKLFAMFEDEPRLRFPLIENAAERLLERNILTREQWDAATEEARQKSFMITGDLTKHAIVEIRDALVEDVQSGTSLAGFKNRIADKLETGALGPFRIETIYRTNVQGAFRDGRETLASDPIVSSVFPYQEYIPVHDTRTRHEHLELGKLGLNGTGIYRRDDPFWDSFTPPIDFNCRCGVRMLTVEAAARAGVAEAQKWLDSGRPPERPQWRYEQIPFEPKPGFGSRGRVGVVV